MWCARLPSRPPGGLVPGTWQLVSLDGSTLTWRTKRRTPPPSGAPGPVAGQRLPAAPVRGAGRERHARPLRARLGPYATGETTLAPTALQALCPGCCAWPTGCSSATPSWTRRRHGAALCWRVKHNLRLPCEERLPRRLLPEPIYPSAGGFVGTAATGMVRARSSSTSWPALPERRPCTGCVTTLLDPGAAPAPELAALYHERGRSRPPSTS